MIELLLVLQVLARSTFILPSAYAATEHDAYIFQAPTISYSGTAPDIIQKIETQVNQITNSPTQHLIGVRLWGTANQLLWGKGRLVSTLSHTYPYLTSTTQNKLKPYLNNIVTSHLLNTSSVNSEISGSAGTNGTKNYGMNWSNNHAFCWDTLYGLWAFGHFTGDWSPIQNNWSQVKNIYNTCQGNASRTLGSTRGNNAYNSTGINSEIAGLMAMARMANRYETSLASTVASRAATKINEKISQTNGASNNPVRLLNPADLGRFLYLHGLQDLTPDVARVLRDKNQTKIISQVNTVTNRFRTWFLSDFDKVSDWMSRDQFPAVTDSKAEYPGEEGYQMTLFASPIYLSKAYITNAPLAELRKELPIGSNSLSTPSHFDILRLQHLTALAHRYSTVTWK
jgi:hypothetical protein